MPVFCRPLWCTMQRDFKKEMEDMLEKHGGLYTFDDILAAIESGRMQSFTDGETWVVTQVDEFPRKTVLSIVVVVGNLDALKKLEPSILKYADEVGADMVTATGRLGWLKHSFENWKAVSANFVRI